MKSSLEDIFEITLVLIFISIIGILFFFPIGVWAVFKRKEM